MLQHCALAATIVARCFFVCGGQLADGATAEVFDDALPISHEDYEYIRNNIRSLYLCGEIKYQDVFNKHRTTKFRLISSKGDFEAGRFTFCDEGNDAT